MPRHPEYVTRSIEGAFEGKHAHASPALVLGGLDASLAGARVEGLAHTIFELVKHMAFWQDLGLEWIRSDKPPADLESAADWPGEASPAGETEWTEALGRFFGGLEAGKRITTEEDLDAAVSGRDTLTRLEILQTAASHNSFHLGQIVQMRRMLGAWPPQEE